MEKGGRGGGERGGSRGRGGPGRGGSSGGRGQSRGGGGARGGHNTGSAKGSDAAAVAEKAVLEERVRQLERATKDVKAMMTNLSPSTGSGSKEQKKTPATQHKNTRVSQSVGNLSDKTKTQSSQKHPHNQGPKKKDDHKHPHNQGPHKQSPKVLGHQGQVRGPFPNAPRHQGPSTKAPPNIGFFPTPPRHSGPFDSFQQERPPSYDRGMANSVTNSFGQMSFTEPPPPYDAPSHPVEIIGDNNGMNIARALSCFRDQFTDAEKLGLQVKMSPKVVVEVVQKHKDVFETMMDGNKHIIELCPKIKLCTYYLTSKGCNAVGTCRRLHLCRNFITDNCRFGDKCQYGHSWETNQNQATLNHFLLSNVDRTILPGLIKKFVLVGLVPSICYHYNNETCRYSDMNCHTLHICKSYVDNIGTCRKDSCKLNHNIVAPHCKMMLEKYGISTNDSPRDLLLKFKLTSESKPKGKETTSSNVTYDKSKKTNNDDNKVMNKKSEKSVITQEENSSDNESTCDSTDSGQSSASAQGTKVKKSRNRKRTKKENLRKSVIKGSPTDKDIQDKKKKSQRVTCWSTNFHGDDNVVEICLYALDGDCSNEEKGCRYMHCKTPFHWQFLCDDDNWVNLRNYQTKTIEDAFCDVSKETVKLHSLDPSKMDDIDKKLFSIMGTNTWIVNFKTMRIVNESDQLKMYKLRRISTRSAVVSESSKATKWEWYFRDEKDNWIKYGSVDSQGNNAMICNENSDEIEKSFLEDSSKPMELTNSSYKFQVDFNSLKQYNLSTGKECEVRRRPAKRHLYEIEKNRDSLPSNWDPMSGSGIYTCVNLSENWEEYKDIFGDIKRSLPLSKIIKIQRLQNPYLWKAFQNKQEEMYHYFNKAEMNIQRLYYGAKPENVTSICNEYFDWRIHNENSEQAYGKGTYFFNSCATAKQRCTKDTGGSSFLFMAEVILGSVTKGNESDSLPPLNPDTQRRFDTTLDDPEAPTIFVKYNTHEYYPAYIIEIQ